MDRGETRPPDESTRSQVAEGRRIVEADRAADVRLTSSREFAEQERRVTDQAARLDESRLTPEAAADKRLAESNVQLEKAERDGKLDASLQMIRELEWLREDQWQKCDEYQRRVALDHVGQAIGKAYDFPPPPLIYGELPQNDRFIELGNYSDGDFRIKLNKEYFSPEFNDPKGALHAYLHEYRHAYQHEMASRYGKPQFINLVDDPAKASAWQANLAEGQYTTADKDFDHYHNQDVEIDSEDFADRLCRRIYGR